MMNALSSTHGNIFQVKVPFSFRKKLSAFTIGQRVIAKYENCYYPGEVLKVPPETSAKICTLERSGKKFWKCPGREDVKYAIQDIIKTTKTSTVVSHLGTTFCYWIWLCLEFSLVYPLDASSLNNVDKMLCQCLCQGYFNLLCLLAMFLVDGEHIWLYFAYFMLVSKFCML